MSILTKVQAEIEDLMNSVSAIDDKILIANQLRSTISLYDGPQPCGEQFLSGNEVTEIMRLNSIEPSFEYIQLHRLQGSVVAAWYSKCGPVYDSAYIAHPAYIQKLYRKFEQNNW